MSDDLARMMEVDADVLGQARALIAAEPLRWYRLLCRLSVFGWAEVLHGVRTGRWKEVERLIELARTEKLCLARAYARLVADGAVSPEQVMAMARGRRGSLHAAPVIASALRSLGEVEAIRLLRSSTAWSMSDAEWNALGSDERRLSVLKSPLQLGLSIEESEALFGNEFDETTKVLKTKTKMIREYSGQSKLRNQTVMQLRLVFEQGHLVGWDDERERVIESERLPQLLERSVDDLTGWHDEAHVRFAVFVTVSLAELDAGREASLATQLGSDAAASGALWQWLEAKYGLNDAAMDVTWEKACIAQHEALPFAMAAQTRFVAFALGQLKAWREVRLTEAERQRQEREVHELAERERQRREAAERAVRDQARRECEREREARDRARREAEQRAEEGASREEQRRQAEEHEARERERRGASRRLSAVVLLIAAVAVTVISNTRSEPTAAPLPIKTEAPALAVAPVEPRKEPEVAAARVPKLRPLCGDPTANPGIDNWSQWTCSLPASPDCLLRARYAPTARGGCPGVQQCCPPPGAQESPGRTTGEARPDLEEFLK